VLHAKRLPMSSLHLYNTLTRQKQLFQPLVAGQVSMYVCGMTIYDFCHIGHARMGIAFDVIQRWLRNCGYKVIYVRNITDIDDKIIKRAVENNESISALTERFIRLMNEDLAALGLQEPDHTPRATQYVPQMLNLIELLQGKGLAYQAGSGDVNFSVRKLAGYGKLSGKSLDDLRAGERVAVDDDKQDPLDFVLWKHSKPSEPDEAKWPSRYGPGRPGWHIECSAMSSALLGQQMDIHGGGADLIFPHHENEIAQSEGAHGGTFARYWLHNGFVRLDDEKMSKSLGNFFTIREVIKQYDPEVVRFLLLRAHYRSPINYSAETIEDARVGLMRLYTALSADAPAISQAVKPDFSSVSGQAFSAAMNDDINTPEACAVLFDLANQLNRQHDSATEQQLRSLAGVLGLLGQARSAVTKSGLRGTDHAVQLDEANIAQLVNARAQAKQSRDFARADAIRQQLLQSGVVLEDTASGTTWRRA
jgi:cysteinyl-tRNA synthetase